MTEGWGKAQHSYLAHYYRGGAALCGTVARQKLVGLTQKPSTYTWVLCHKCEAKLTEGRQ